MFHLVLTLSRAVASGLKSRLQLMLENLALRHQLAVLKRSMPKHWQRVLLLIQLRTFVGWHRLGFRLF